MGHIMGRNINKTQQAIKMMQKNAELSTYVLANMLIIMSIFVNIHFLK